MKVKHTLCFFICLLLCNEFATAQEQYSKVKINIEHTTMHTLCSLGIETEHGEYKANYYFINWLSKNEIEGLKQNNIPFEVLIEDSKTYYATSNNTPKISAVQQCYPLDFTTPAHYHQGSMAGFLTYAEMISELDSMATLFPNLISARNAVGTTTTILGDTVWHVKISDNPTIKESENEIMYTAVHHAREPMGMQNLIFYMWYLLENYNNDSLVKYIVDNTELYFVPCINVDGYKQNEITNPFGGGLWRKNMRDNLDGTFGVDLNRNYGFNWGFDDTGSSPNTSSNTYRGTGAFSEPETQSIRDFCLAHDFHIVLNYHSYGNWLIYPWGYVPDLYTPDSALFVDFGSMITLHNNYKYGTPNQTVNYVTNGSSDDWMYGEQTSKDKVFALTPETGYDFWPSQPDIDGIVKSNMYANIQAALIAGKYATVSDESDISLTTYNGYLKFKVDMHGLDTAGTYTVSVANFTNVINVGPAKIYANLLTGQNILDSISYQLNSAMVYGDEAKFILSISNGLHTWSDTISKVFTYPTFVFDDNCSNTTKWNTTSWSTTTAKFVSVPSSITDSPFGNYADNANTQITSVGQVVLNNSPELSFYARWEIEPVYDYVQLLISDNNGVTWTPLCGKYTTEGSATQDAGQPIYDGFQKTWVKEHVNLQNYMGKSIKLRFKLVSDFGNTYDGFYFDDIRINGGSAISFSNIPGVQYYIAPNPVGKMLRLHTDRIRENITVVLQDVQGREVLTYTIKHFDGEANIPTENLLPGIYLINISDPYNEIKVLKCVKL